MVQVLDAACADALQRAHDAIPVEYVEVRPGRRLAVHRRVNSQSPDVAFFVHGSCASMVQWQKQMDAFPNYSIVAYDYFGCGRSPRPDGWDDYSFFELYQDLRAVVFQFGAETGVGKNIIFAHSTGCALAINLAADDAISNLQALVFLAPVDDVPAIAKGILFKLPVWVLNRIQTTLSAGFVKKAFHVDSRTEGTPQYCKDTILLAQATCGLNPMHMCKAYYRQIEFPSREIIADIAVPVLFLHGADDELIEPASSRRLQGMFDKAQSSRVELANCSHQLMQEKPEAVNEEAAKFLGKIAQPARGG